MIIDFEKLLVPILFIILFITALALIEHTTDD